MTKRRFGQHFLHDQNVLNNIINAIGPEKDDNMVEIGPGPGALTKKLLPHLHTLTAIEIDQDLIPNLTEDCKNIGDLTIISQDVLTVDFTQFGNMLRVVGNLPYNISTPILFHLLPHINNIIDMHFMLQKEVVDRMAAKPNTKDYGRLSVMLQYHCDVTSLFHVSPNSFTPPPKVNSAIVKLVPRRPNNLPDVNQKLFANIVKQAFAGRRKMLRKSLQSLVTSDQLIAIGIDPTYRAERLTVTDFCKICNTIED